MVSHRDDLGRDVLGRPADGVQHPVGAGGLLGEPEVRDLDGADVARRRQQQVLQLQVPVRHAPAEWCQG